MLRAMKNLGWFLQGVATELAVWNCCHPCSSVELEVNSFPTHEHIHRPRCVRLRSHSVEESKVLISVMTCSYACNRFCVALWVVVASFMAFMANCLLCRAFFLECWSFPRQKQLALPQLDFNDLTAWGLMCRFGHICIQSLLLCSPELKSFCSKICCSWTASLCRINFFALSRVKSGSIWRRFEMKVSLMSTTRRSWIISSWAFRNKNSPWGCTMQ